MAHEERGAWLEDVSIVSVAMVNRKLGAEDEMSSNREAEVAEGRRGEHCSWNRSESEKVAVDNSRRYSHQ